MNALELKLITRCAQFRVEKSLPGKLILRFPLARLLPASARPHMRYLEDTYRVLPGVQEAHLEETDGRLTLIYDAGKQNEQSLLDWWNVILREGTALAGDNESTRGKDAGQIAALLTERLSKHI